MRLKGKEEGWTDLVVLTAGSSSKSVPVVILVSKGNRSWTMTVFSAAEAEYPLVSWIEEWSFILFPLNGSSMTWAWKEWNSMLRETQLKGENSWLQGLSRSALSASLYGFVFSSSSQTVSWVSQHISTALGWKMKQLQRGCSFFLHKLWKMKAKAEL